MPKAKSSASAKPRAASKETDEMKMRKNLGKLAELSREALIEADLKTIECLVSHANALWSAFGEHCKATDKVAIKREPTGIENARRDVAEDDFEKALIAFLSYSPKTIEGVSLKAVLLDREECLFVNIENHWEIYAKSLIRPGGQTTTVNEGCDQGVMLDHPAIHIADLIEAHRGAHTAANAAPVHMSEPEREKLWDAADAAFETLLSHGPASLPEVSAVASYLNEDEELLERVFVTGGYGKAFLEALISSGKCDAVAATEGPTMRDLIDAHRAHMGSFKDLPEDDDDHPGFDAFYKGAAAKIIAIVTHQCRTLNEAAERSEYLLTGAGDLIDNDVFLDGEKWFMPLLRSFTRKDGQPLATNGEPAIMLEKAKEQRAQASEVSEPVDQKPGHVYAYGRDFGPASEKALSLIQKHKEALERYFAANDAADRRAPGASVGELVRLRDEAHVEEVRAGMACVEHWYNHTGTADEIAIENYAFSENIEAVTIKEICALPNVVIEALIEAFVTPKKSQNELTALENDPALLLFKLMSEAEAESHRCDEQYFYAEKGRDASRKIYFEGASRDHFQRLTGLRDALAAMEADTAYVAMAQIAEAISRIDLIESQTEDFASNDKRAIDRLLYSALRFVEQSSGLRIEGVGLGFLRQRHLDPWETVENRLEMIKEPEGA